MSELNDVVGDYWDDPARDTVHGPKSYLHREPVRQVKYRTIVADPPWPYPEGFAQTVPTGKDRRKGGVVVTNRHLPYSAMTLTDIAALRIPEVADTDCRLFCWTTNRYLPDAFRIVAGWSFDYRQTLVWHKPDAFFGGSVAPNAEFLIVATRGKPQRLGRGANAVISHAQRQLPHSRKPDVFLDLVEQVSPGPYLELFARRRRIGWDAWGNEWYPDIKLDPADLAAYRNACDMADWREDMERGADPELYQAIQRRKRRE